MKYFALIAAAALTAIVTSQASAQYIPPPSPGGTTPQPSGPYIPPPAPRY